VARELHKQGLDFVFQFVGAAEAKDPYAAAFLEQIKPLEAAGCAHYVGRKSTEGLISVFDSSAALVHFPSEEAFGLVVAEALARNLKLFGARTGGIMDITAGAPGVELFDVEDWPGLSAAIAAWIRSGSPRASGCAEVMRLRYHPDVIAHRHLEIYRQVISDLRTSA
jgi:glycosyltransferase involved in cell wall biosynthesis